MNALIGNFQKDLASYYTPQGFYDACQDFGTEHYKLLMSISRQLTNVKILEIGTHHGNSAIALSYGKLHGKNIQVDTYDIVDLLQENPRQFFSQYGVNYYIKDLLNNEMRNQYKDEILSYDVIFIDVDPHEGILEYDMYLWLKNNNYQGIIIYDDIHLGIDHDANGYHKTEHAMEDFWNKIDNHDKTDITHLGHITGTGIVSFVQLDIIT